MDAGRLYKLARDLRQIAVSASADEGEPPAPAGVVAIGEDLARHDRTTVAEITARTGLAQSMVSKTVAAMRAEGILTVRPDPDDGRRSLITLTRRARRETFTARGARPVTQALRAQWPHLSAARQARAERLLDELDRLVRD